MSSENNKKSLVKTVFTPFKISMTLGTVLLGLGIYQHSKLAGASGVIIIAGSLLVEVAKLGAFVR
jgi:hypothetical protein